MRSGFSSVELLVVVGIVLVLFSIIVPYVMKVREMDKRVRCANNLRGLHRALYTYAEWFGHEYPMVEEDPSDRNRYVAFTGADVVPPRQNPATPVPASRPATSPAAPTTGPAVDGLPSVMPTTTPAVAAATPTSPASKPTTPRPGVQPNDATASLWLLVRFGLASPYQFVCPSSSNTPDPVMTMGQPVPFDHRSNFTAGRHLSYSYSSPFSGAPKFGLNSDRLPADFAILADKNPGRDPANAASSPRYDSPPLELARANSLNHSRAGQNVLYATGAVEFQKTPYCGFGKGWFRDNIYSAYAEKPLPAGAPPEDLYAPGVILPRAGPAWEFDSYLVPTEGE